MMPRLCWWTAEVTARLVADWVLRVHRAACAGYNTLEDARAPIKEHIMQQQRRYCEREQVRAGTLSGCADL